ncbi:MAG: hypothetical protein K2F83_02685 [Oscillospiraceae bacterium]|nr:hypothetical protein [Oscillospiraceae bacterium]
MKILKEANAMGEETVSEQDLALINAQSRKELKAEEVYTFTVRLCDNEVDREWERFPRETLEELAGLFVGKSGIFDHNWSAAGQSARIYKTEVVAEPGQVTKAGDPACYLKGWAYMLRTERSADLIEEIEGGIKKEVSVGCSVAREVCSVCGEVMGKCQHVKGRTYNGKLCWGELKGATDAYEWSFVAVPAQPKAGVMKGLGLSLKELAQSQESARRELEALEKEASLGRKYLEELRQQVVKLAAVSEPSLDVGVVKSIAGKLEEDELRALQAFFTQKGEERWQGMTQLEYGSGQGEKAPEDGAFLV